MWTLTVVFCMALTPMQPVRDYCVTEVLEDVAPSFPLCVLRAYGMSRLVTKASDRFMLSARCDRQVGA